MCSEQLGDAYDIVEVVWIDAVCEQARLDERGIASVHPLKRVNVGYVLEDNDDFVRFCWGILDNDEFDMTQAISKRMILSMRELG